MTLIHTNTIYYYRAMGCATAGNIRTVLAPNRSWWDTLAGILFSMQVAKDDLNKKYIQFSSGGYWSIAILHLSYRNSENDNRMISYDGARIWSNMIKYHDMIIQFRSTKSDKCSSHLQKTADKEIRTWNNECTLNIHSTLVERLILA